MRFDTSHLIVVCTVVAGTSVYCGAPRTAAAYVTVYGGPTYTPGSGGYQAYNLEACPIGDGFVSFTANKYSAAGANLGTRAVRVTTDGAPPLELATLGTSSSGVTSCYAYGGNAVGLVVGQAHQYGSTGTDLGFRAVRWAPDGAATQLDDLMPGAVGNLRRSSANAIDGAGNVVGYSAKQGSGGADLGYRAVRWDAGGAAMTELEPLSVRPDGYANTYASTINVAGSVIGASERYDASGASLGLRAVRWPAGSTVPIELPTISGLPTSNPEARPAGINDAGVVVGSVRNYDVSGGAIDLHAVRWSADGSTVVELQSVEVSPQGYRFSSPSMINGAGVTVGSSAIYSVHSQFFGSTFYRAVRWSPDSTTPVVLGRPDIPESDSFAYAINASGTTVGYFRNYTFGTSIGTLPRAFAWDENGAWTDLNTLIDPASGWILRYAYTISDTGWIGGVGSFDPDGSGPRGAYDRNFLLQIPEPAALGLTITLAGAFSLTRRARRSEVGRP